MDQSGVANRGPLGRIRVGVGAWVNFVDVDATVTTAVTVLIFVVESTRGHTSSGSTSSGSCGGKPGGTTRPPGRGGLLPGAGQPGAE